MDTLRLIILAIHLLSWAFIVGAWASRLRTPVPVAKGVPHAAATALVTGLLMVGLLEMDDVEINHVKIAFKLVIALVVTVLAFVAQRKADNAPVWMAHAIGGGAVINVLIAVLWT